MSKVILADSAYIPKDLVNMAKVRKNYEKHVYDERMCKTCDNKPERFNDICATCPAFKGFFQTWKKEVIKGKPYVAVPIGNFDQIKEYLGIDLDEVEVDDRRADVPATDPLNFTKKLYDGTEVIGGVQQADQKGVIKTFWKKKRGLIKARPRTGKTVMAVRLLCAYQRRALVVAHERELLKQFLRTLRKFTDLREREAKAGRKLAGIIQKDSDWDENWDTVLCTYQKFIHPTRGRERINKHVRRKFGLLIVDEVHRANADTYSRFINYIDTKWRFGLTATVERKDQCFVPGTLVQMADGTRKSIETITAGEVVLGYDHTTHAFVPSVVEGQFSQVPDSLIEIDIDGQTFVCTPWHEFWSETRNMYVRADELSFGEQVKPPEFDCVSCATKI